MAKPKSKIDEILSYVWTGLIVTCIAMLLAHLIDSGKLTTGSEKELVEKTFTTR